MRLVKDAAPKRRKPRRRANRLYAETAHHRGRCLIEKYHSELPLAANQAHSREVPIRHFVCSCRSMSEEKRSLKVPSLIAHAKLWNVDDADV